MNQELNNVRIEILKRFPTQTDFAVASNISESSVSRVLRGRKKLSEDEVKIWIETLKCNPELLKPITKEE
jgi:hypothetical protein